MAADIVPFIDSRRYVIEREIGQGGMGVVYQAHDLERNTRVALKALNQSDALNIYRLKNEFRQLADVSHPNLVSLHELCFDGDKWFFTMELVDGQTFDEYVAAQLHTTLPADRSALTTIAGRNRIIRDASVTLSQRAIGSEFPLPRITCNVARLRHALRQLVEAIAALHNAGKLHRDIKPSNVLVTSSGRVVVLDFGLVSNSTHIDADAQDAERTIGGCVFGTPAYMSPEQAAGEAVTTAADWYSVGAILYEALTGQLPFDGTVLQILKAKDELEPVPPAEVVAGVPDDLDQLCRNLLQRDPSRRMSAHDILRHLSGGASPQPAYDASAAAPDRFSGELFVGRETHMQQLRDAFESVKQGKRVTVFVHGHSGMGKSALVRCFANELIKKEAAVVLRGRCYERESVPYKALDDIIDALGRYMMQLSTDEAAELLPRNIHALARLFPVLKRVKAVAQAHAPLHQPSDQRELRDQAFNALRDLLLRISDWHPLVINIDDLQWGDMDSARLLTHLFGSLEAPPVLFVGTYRREESTTSPFLRHVLADPALGSVNSRTVQIAVDPLSSDEAEQLTRAMLREHPLATALFTRTIAAESDGVPFFVGELAQHVKAQAHRSPATLESVSLDNVLATRIATMSLEGQRVLEVLSVAARPLEQGVALEAAGLPTGDRAALLALRAARLIRTRGTRQTDLAETFHDRVRETVVAQLSKLRVRELHAAIARASESWGVGEPEQLVVHYTEAGHGLRAGETAIQAAHAATEKLAFNRAAELYRKALHLIPGKDAERRRDLNRLLGDALANAGRGAQAAEAYLEVGRLSQDYDSRRFRRLAAQQMLRSGRMHEGTELALAALHDVGIKLPETRVGSIAMFLWNRARIAIRGIPRASAYVNALPSDNTETVDTLGSMFQEVSVFDMLRGALLHSIFLLEALRGADRLRVLQALSWDVVHQSVLGHPGNCARAEVVLAEIRRLQKEIDTPYATAMAEMATAAFCCFTGRYNEALAPAARSEEIFHEQVPGAFWERSWVALIRFSVLEFAGDLRRVVDEVPEYAQRAIDRDDLFSNAVLIMPMANSHLMKDDVVASQNFLREQHARYGNDSPTFHQLITHRSVDALLYARKGREALDRLTAEWPLLISNHTYRGCFMKAVLHYLRARCNFAAYTSDPQPKLLSQLRDDLDIVRALDCYPGGLVSGLEASLEHFLGRDDLAVTCAKRGVAEFEVAGLHRCRAYVLRRLGELTRDQGGDRLIEEADQLMSAQGILRPDRWVALQIGALVDPAG